MRTGNSGHGALVSYVGASGGVGKSSLALMSGWLAARCGLRACIVEADLQFGDMGFWLGLDDELATLADGAAAKPLEIAENLMLYKAPCFPEVAENVAEEVAELAVSVCKDYDITFADTGALWSGLTAELVVKSDAFALVFDERPSSLAGAMRASELCGRIGAPDAKRVCVYNRWSKKAKLSADQAAKGLEVNSVRRVPDGKKSVDDLFCTGDIDELVEMQNPFACGVDALLAEVLPSAGCPYAPIFAERKARWFA